MSASNQLFDVYHLPDQRDMFLNDWDVVVMPEETKNLLVSYAQTLRRLGRVNAAGLALRRAVLLYGPPGCGKTSLARGLPAKWSEAYRVPRTGFIHVNTHALFSGIRGEGQKNVLATFQQIAEIATSRLPIFVLVDEVETLGTDRSSISLEANPLDALYQVTAFFESLDRCARELPNVTFLFTTNIPKAIDRAVRERVDFVLEIPLPSPKYRSLILRDAVRSLHQAYDVRELMDLAGTWPAHPRWAEMIEGSAGLSGRALRHVLVVAATLAGDSEALRPEHLRDALRQVAEAEEGLRQSGGTYIEDYQRPGTAPPSVPPPTVAEDQQPEAEPDGQAEPRPDDQAVAPLNDPVAARTPAPPGAIDRTDPAVTQIPQMPGPEDDGQEESATTGPWPWRNRPGRHKAKQTEQTDSTQRDTR